MNKDSRKQEPQNSPLLESFKIAAQSFKNKSFKEVVRSCIQTIEHESDVDPIALVKEGFNLGVGLNGLSKEDLKSGAIRIFKVLAAKTLTSTEKKPPTQSKH